MNCCYSRLRIHVDITEVDITEVDIPEDENLIREHHDMLEEDARMLSIRRKERRFQEDERRVQEDCRRAKEVEKREEENSRIIKEVNAYNRYQAYQDVKSIYYLHPLTIDHELYQLIKEEDRWKEEDLRRSLEDIRRTQEDKRRIQEDKSQPHKKYARRILVKSNVEPRRKGVPFKNWSNRWSRRVKYLDKVRFVIPREKSNFLSHRSMQG